MTPGDEPTNWDINRRLNELESDHKDLARQHSDDMRDIHQRLADAKSRSEDTYLRKDVYLEARRADQGVVANVVETVRGVKARLDTDEAFRRQVLLGFSIAAIASLTSIAIAVFSLLAR